jgi:hypothetical protein
MPQFKICKNELKLVLENKNYKTENIYKKRNRKKGKDLTWPQPIRPKPHAGPA